MARESVFPVVSVPMIGAAVPELNGFEYTVYSGHEFGLGSKHAATLPTVNEPIKSWISEIQDPDFRVSVNGTHVVINSRDQTSYNRPDWYLLSRWWVNGKPVVPSRGSFVAAGGDGDPHLQTSLQFDLKLDPKAFGAVAGDKISFQLMNCYWEFIDSAPWASLNGPTRLSNRVDFVLGE